MAVYVGEELQKFLKQEGLTALYALASDDVLQRARKALEGGGLDPAMRNTLDDLIKVAEIRRRNQQS